MATTTTIVMKPAEKALLAELKKKSARLNPSFVPLVALLKYKFVTQADKPKKGNPLFQVTDLGKTQNT